MPARTSVVTAFRLSRRSDQVSVPLSPPSSQVTIHRHHLTQNATIAMQRHGVFYSVTLPKDNTPKILDEEEVNEGTSS